MRACLERTLVRRRAVSRVKGKGATGPGRRRDPAGSGRRYGDGAPGRGSRDASASSSRSGTSACRRAASRPVTASTACRTGTPNRASMAGPLTERSASSPPARRRRSVLRGHWRRGGSGSPGTRSPGPGRSAKPTPLDGFFWPRDLPPPRFHLNDEGPVQHAVDHDEIELDGLSDGSGEGNEVVAS